MVQSLIFDDLDIFDDLHIFIIFDSCRKTSRLMDKAKFPSLAKTIFSQK